MYPKDRKRASANGVRVNKGRGVEGAASSQGLDFILSMM